MSVNWSSQSIADADEIKTDKPTYYEMKPGDKLVELDALFKLLNRFEM